MTVKDVALAEEALALPAPERAGLARLLVASLEGDPRLSEEIQRDLQQRLTSIRSGEDPGLTFDQMFGESQ